MSLSLCTWFRAHVVPNVKLQLCAHWYWTATICHITALRVEVQDIFHPSTYPTADITVCSQMGPRLPEVRTHLRLGGRTEASCWLPEGFASNKCSSYNTFRCDHMPYPLVTGRKCTTPVRCRRSCWGCYHLWAINHLSATLSLGRRYCLCLHLKVEWKRLVWNGRIRTGPMEGVFGSGLSDVV